MKLWHDDIRRPPSDDWTWARTNTAAKELLSSNTVTEISMDHDLGLHELDPDIEGSVFMIGQDRNTGLDLVRWMINKQLVPEKVNIHSWNGVGAQNMLNEFHDAGFTYATYRPYQA